MRGEERQAACELAAQGAGALAAEIGELHAAIAARVFWALRVGGIAFPPLAAVSEPVRAGHDLIAARAYGAAGRACAAVLRASGRLAAAAAPRDARGLDASPDGRLVLGVLGGVIGDRLADGESPLAVQMTLRAGSEPVKLRRAELARAFPRATPRLAVFLHGLCETEQAWWLHAERGPTYGERLAAALGFRPVYVRYNSGRHISENGRELVALLEGLVGAWPVEVCELALIGHSMGGLVARSACHHGAGSGVIARVRHVVCLGSPHYGATLERGVHVAAVALWRLPETRGLAGVLRLRSAGITDLHRGYLTDEDWISHDPDSFLRAAAREVPFAAHADHYFLAATLTGDPEAPLGRLFGDLLVTRASAWAQRRCERVRFPIDHYACIGPANHFDLLNHPAVAQQLVRWLACEEPSPQ
jgi:hypothetical protein